MARLARSVRLAKNAECALIAAIEIYNKPAFAYRDETFAILALNAWELLLKAKLLAESNNQQAILRIYEKRKMANGELSKKEYVKRNRSGNEMTIGVEASFSRLEGKGIAIAPAVKKNVEGLIEIRDNAIHYVNASPQLAKQVLEIGTATLRNFIQLGKLWFALDLTKYGLFLMPIGFLPSPDSATAIPTSADEKNLVTYLAGLSKASVADANKDFHVSLDVNISFKRTSAADATTVIVTNDPGAIPVALTEENIRKTYPWDYAELRKRLRARYLDFKENAEFYAVKKPLMADARYVKMRYLDPGNPRSARKPFFNPNILREFDKLYALKK